MSTILLTGFEPFGGSAINPSLELARSLDGERLRASDGGAVVAAVRTTILPVVGGAAPAILRQLIREERPAALVMLGESARAQALTIERLGVNLRDYRIPDEGGARVRGEPIDDDAADALRSTLPVEAMLRAARQAGVPATDSLSAGAYLCNEVLYSALAFAARERLRLPIGFVHLPRLPQQVATEEQPGPSMALETMRSGLVAMLGALVREGATAGTA